MKKVVLFLALPAALSGLILAADWRAELNGFFRDEKAADYKGAIAYLQERIESFGKEDKPVACGLLAYLHGRLGDKQDEYRRLGEYFEKYGAVGMGFTFLPLFLRNDALRYLRDWQLRYPWVFKIGLVAPGDSEEKSPLLANPPETILLGVEMASDVYYKLMDDEKVIKGGRFHRGYNAIPIQAWKFFRGPGAYSLVLEFKAGDFIVQRELVLAVQMDYVGIMGKPSGGREGEEFLLEMYFGADLLASSRKTLPSAREMGIEPPPPSGKFDPFGPGYQNEPRIPSGVPILAIPAAIVEAVKALKKKDEVEPVPPPKLKADMNLSFKRPNARGDDIEVRAQVSLGLREMRFLPYSMLDQN